MTQTATDLYKEGRLNDAIADLIQQVKKRPSDPDPRGFLSELLCFAGSHDRVDVHLDAIAGQDPEAAVTISLFRQLVRAEIIRHQMLNDGRVPEFLEQPPEHIGTQLRGLVALREGKNDEALALMAEAEAARPPAPGDLDGQAFDDMRDIDDLFGPVLEVLTSNGKYFWLPMERVELIEFRAPERPRDLYWRRARVVSREGTDGEVFIPATYPISANDPEVDERTRLGRVTTWSEDENAPVRGAGQRCFLVGEEAVPIMQMEVVTFAASGTG